MEMSRSRNTPDETNPTSAKNPDPTPAEITQLLSRFHEQDAQVDEQLLVTVYRELRILAGHYMRLERPGHLLQPTALINEAYLRLERQRHTRWENRKHFFAVAAMVMRRILVDIARHEQGARSVPMTDMVAVTPKISTKVVVIDQALVRLSALEPNHAKALELKYFGGLTNQEIASCMHISESTVEKYLRLGRAWLETELGS